MSGGCGNDLSFVVQQKCYCDYCQSVILSQETDAGRCSDSASCFELISRLRNSLLFARFESYKCVGILRYFMECVCTFTCILRSVFRSLSSMLVSCTSHVCFSASLRRRDFVVVLVFGQGEIFVRLTFCKTVAQIFKTREMTFPLNAHNSKD